MFVNLPADESSLGSSGKTLSDRLHSRGSIVPFWAKRTSWKVEQSTATEVDDPGCTQPRPNVDIPALYAAVSAYFGLSLVQRRTSLR